MSAALPPPAKTASQIPWCDLPKGWPSLENGDRMNREEFHRRYLLRPDIKKAELIEGIVYIMSSPVRARTHGRPHKLMIAWLANYERRIPQVESYNDATLQLDDGNEPRPDAMLCLDASCGGRSRLTEDDYVEGAPE